MNDSHLETWAAETRESASDAAWYAWHDEATRIAGCSLDGDRQATNPAPDRYSVDDAYAAFLSGSTPSEYIQRTPEPTAAEETARDDEVERLIAEHEASLPTDG